MSRTAHRSSIGSARQSGAASAAALTAARASACVEPLKRRQHVLVVVRLHDLVLGAAAGLALAADVGLEVMLAALEPLDLLEQASRSGLPGA